jgi:hypothetical protein
MPKPATPRVPSYRRHKPTGQAVVTINGRDIYLGKWNSAASKDEYDRLIAEFLANGRRLQSDADTTVVEVLNAYRKFAENYYRKDGRVTSEYGCILDNLKIVRELYGRKIANDSVPWRSKPFVNEWLINVGAVATSTSRSAGFAGASNGRWRMNWFGGICTTGLWPSLACAKASICVCGSVNWIRNTEAMVPPTTDHHRSSLIA